MFLMHRLVASLLLGAAVDGFRMKSRRKQGAPTGKELDYARIFNDVVKRTEGELNGKTVFDPRIYEEEQKAGTNDIAIITPDDFPKCYLSQSNCSIKDLTEATLVYTDSDTSLCWNGEPWAFLVHPGRSDKLLYYFPNGGASWEFPFVLPGAITISLPSLLLGLFVTGYGSGVSNYSNPQNGFQDFTFVSPPYCTGGAHVANTTVSGIFGVGYQHDYNNNEFATTWALNNLDQTLDSFVIAGSSAGSLGTMAWADLLLSTFQYEKATVIIDSYMGVFPDDTQGPTIKNFGCCNLPIFRKFKAACEAGTSNIQDIFDQTIENHPTVAFAAVQPKWDLVQRAFYAAMALSYFDLNLYYSSSGFYKDTNTMMQRYGRHPNFVNYYIDGGFHTFLWWGFHYSATVSGESDLSDTDGKPTLAEWINALVKHEPVQSQCKGPLRKNGGGLLWFGGTQYCDSKLYPKPLSVAR